MCDVAQFFFFWGGGYETLQNYGGGWCLWEFAPTIFLSQWQPPPILFLVFFKTCFPVAILKSLLGIAPGQRAGGGDSSEAHGNASDEQWFPCTQIAPNCSFPGCWRCGRGSAGAGELAQEVMIIAPGPRVETQLCPPQLQSFSWEVGGLFVSIQIVQVWKVAKMLLSFFVCLFPMLT